MNDLAAVPNILDHLQQETLRLIKVQRLMYDRLLEDPDLLEEDRPDQTLDRRRVRAALEQLDGEAAKVQKFEMVLAVVGTMKAGKSTCINAIVGTEVLPNRSEPMTAIPTLIRHVKGQTVPKLRMQNPGPLEQLAREIKPRLSDPEISRRPEFLDISGTPDGQNLIAEIRRGSDLQFQGEHLGPEQIFAFLKSVNDLVRLSSAVSIPFPFDEYNEMDEYPVVEVEFFHLRDQDDNKGLFTILDTPGPNEAGNPHLKVMLRDQLTKASALLAVVDYTQVKSEADTEVRDQLLEAIGLAKCRAYVLVNKYDQKDRNDKRTADQLRLQIATDRLGGRVSADVVFPVSARRAYLSNRTLSHLAHENSLPEELTGWMEDFVNEAFGTSVDPEELQDSEEVKRRAMRLWERSNFQNPIDAVVRSSCEQAELMSMEAAGNKMERLAKTLSNLLEVREGGLSVDVGKVQALIRSLSDDSSRLSALRVEVEKRVNDAAKSVGQKVKQEETRSRKKLTESLEKFFSEGRSIVESARKEAKQERKLEELALQQARENFRQGAILPTFGSWLDGVTSLIGARRVAPLAQALTENMQERLWNPEKPVVEVPEKDRAKLNSLLRGVLKETSKLTETANESFTSSVSILLKALEEGIGREFESTGNAIKEAVEKHTKVAGIKVDFQLPRLPRFDSDVQVQHIVDSAVNEREEEEQRTRMVERKSVGGKVKRFAGRLFGQSDWGYDTESYTVTKTTLILDLGDLRTKLIQSVQESFAGLGETATRYIREDLKEKLGEYFQKLDEQVKQLQGDLARSLGDRKKEQASLAAFMARLKQMKSRSSSVVSETATLVNQLRDQVNSSKAAVP